MISVQSVGLFLDFTKIANVSERRMNPGRSDKFRRLFLDKFSHIFCTLAVCFVDSIHHLAQCTARFGDEFHFETDRITALCQTIALRDVEKCCAFVR